MIDGLLEIISKIVQYLLRNIGMVIVCFIMCFATHKLTINYIDEQVMDYKAYTEQCYSNLRNQVTRNAIYNDDMFFIMKRDEAKVKELMKIKEREAELNKMVEIDKTK